MNITISGLGFYLPERVVESAEIEIELGLKRGWIKRRTGIERRHDAGDESIISMMKLASQQALSNAGYVAGDMDAIISACAIPNCVIPCTAAFLHDALGPETRGCMAFDVNATCLSFMMAMNQASLMIESGQARRILIASAEVPYSSGSLNPDDPSSYCLFGDAAAAMVLEKNDGKGDSRFSDFHFSTYSEYKDLVGVGMGVRKKYGIDEGVSLSDWQFKMDGKGVFRAGLILGEELHQKLFADGGDDVDVVIPHQTNLHGVRAYRKIGFGDRVYSNLAEVGNTISVSLPLALAQAVAEGRVKRGQRVALIGTAAGLSFGILRFIY